MASDLRRSTAVVRDEYRLRDALATHSANRFDAEAAAAVRRRALDLLETLGFLASDAELWERLTTAAQVWQEEQLQALTWFDDAALGAVLVASGYRSPPPPHVDELILQTRHQLALALTSTGHPELVEQARISLHTFVYRTRRQIDLTRASDLGESTIAVVGRRVAHVARELIPTVVAAAAGAAAELHLPGTGVLVAASGKALVEKGTELAAGTVIGRVLTDPPPRVAVEETLELVTPDEAIAAHLATAVTALDAVTADRYGRRASALRDIERHLSRVVDLCRDHGGPNELDVGAALAREAVDAAQRRLAASDRHDLLVGPAVTVDGALEVARAALQVCVAARGESSEYLPAGYCERPFDEGTRFDDGVSRQLSELWANWRGPSSSGLVQDEARSSGRVNGALPEHEASGAPEERRHRFGL